MIMNQKISAKIHWKNQLDDFFIKGKYRRTHSWELESGSQLKASSSIHIVPIPYSNPEFIDPEEAFVCSIASCHMLFFLSIAAKKRIDVLQYDDSPIAILSKNHSKKVAVTKIILNPKVVTREETSKETLENIHELAHQSCFIANSINSKIHINHQ